jgi:sec-independent protein translocase protein TatC
MPATVACFLLGAAFGYWVLLPNGLKFLLNFGTGVAVPLIVLDQYISLLTAMLMWLGIIFELPIAMFLLAKLRIVSYLRLRRLRRYVPVAAFILSAIITPTMDVFNATLMAVPMIALYEVGLFVSWLANTEEGDYMFVKKIRAGLANTEEGDYMFVKKIRAGLAKVLRGIRIVIGFPVVKVRWVYRKVLRKE